MNLELLWLKPLAFRKTLRKKYFWSTPKGKIALSSTETKLSSTIAYFNQAKKKKKIKKEKKEKEKKKKKGIKHGIKYSGRIYVSLTSD